jgi:hypothetical protein
MQISPLVATPTTYFSANIQISMDHDPGYLKKVVSQNPEGGEVPVWAHGIIWSLLENHLAYLLNGTVLSTVML